jgi:hypothetical protein
MPGHDPRLIPCQASAECGHDRASSLHDQPRKLSIGPRRLPTSVAEVRYAGDVRNAAAIDAVTADAVPIVEIHNDHLLLLGAAHPKPGATIQGFNLTRGNVRIAEVSVRLGSVGMLGFHLGCCGCPDTNHGDKDRRQSCPGANTSPRVIA